MKTYANRNRLVEGQSTSATVGGRETESPKNEWSCIEVNEGPGSVRVSVSIGHSEDYGRNKFTVTVDHGLACGQTAEEKERAFTEAKSFCIAKARKLRSEVASTLFDDGGQKGMGAAK